MWAETDVLVRRRVLLDAHRATCCPSRSPIRTRRCGWRPAARARSRRRPAWGSACCASPPARRQQLAPLIETYKREIANAEPVGDYVNDNVMVTSGMLCLEDGQRARDALLATDDNRHKSLLFRYLDTFPRPPGIPCGPS